MTKGRINYWTAEANRGHNWTFTAYWVRDSYLIRCYDQNGTRIPGMFTLVNDEAMDYPPDNERLMNLVLARDEAEEKAGGKPLARPPKNVFDFPSAADWPDTNPATLEAVDVDLSDVETGADVLQDLAIPRGFFGGFSLNLLIFFNTMPSYCPPSHYALFKSDGFSGASIRYRVCKMAG